MDASQLPIPPSRVGLFCPRRDQLGSEKDPISQDQRRWKDLDARQPDDR